MSDQKQGEWCAHVTLANKSIIEVQVNADTGNKYLAVGKVVKILGLTGVNDPNVVSFIIQEVSKPNSKRHEFGNAADKQESKPIVTKDASRFAHQYEVRLYVNPQVSTHRTFNIGANNPYDALEGASKMAGVRQLSDLGPYCVLERQNREDKDGIKYTLVVTRMVKGAAAFPGIGPVQTSGDFRQPSNVIEMRPRVSAAQAVTPQADKFVSEVIDILSKEHKETRKKYTIRQDA